MMSSGKKGILSNSTLFAVFVVALMGANFLDLPYFAAKYGGSSGYWSIIVGFILMIPIILIAIAFKNRFPKQNLMEVSSMVIGKSLALIGNLLFLSSYLVLLLLAVRNGVTIIDSYLLNRTPLLAIMIVILISILYMVVNGLAAVSRFITFLLIPTYLFRLIMELFGLQKMEITNLLPLFSEKPIQYLIGGLNITAYFFPLTAIFLLSNRLQSQPKLGKTLFGAMAAIFPIYLIAFIGTVGNFGTKYTQIFNWPEVAMTNHVNIPFLVIENLGLLFLIVWLTTFLATKILYAYIFVSGLKQQFPVLKYRWIAAIIILLVGIIGLYFPSSFSFHQIFTDLRPWLMVPVTIYPFCIYILALLRGKRGNMNES